MATRLNKCPNPFLKVDASDFFTGSGVSAGARQAVTAPDRGFGYHVTHSATTSDIFPPVLAVATAGTAYTFSLYVQTNAAVTAYFQVDWYNGATFVDFAQGTSTSFGANTWTRLSVTSTAPATTTKAQFTLHWTVVASGNTSDVTELLYEPAGALGSYFDGDTAGATWDGANGASTSTLVTGSAPPSPGLLVSRLLPYFG